MAISLEIILIVVLVVFLIVSGYFYYEKTTPCPTPAPCLINPVLIKAVQTGNYLVRDGSFVSDKSKATPFVLEQNNATSGQIYPIVNGHLLQFTIDSNLVGVLSEYGHTDYTYDVDGTVVNENFNRTISDAMNDPKCHITFEKM